MFVRVLLFVIVWMRFHDTVTSSQCRDSDMKFSVRSYRNQTGHWITKLQVASGAPADDEGELQTGHWTIEVDQNTRICEANSDSITLGATITAPPPLAGPGYELFPGIGRYKFHSSPVTWDEARVICSKEGGHLAIINSEPESQVLMKLFASHPDNTLKTGNNNYVFIGFNDKFEEGTYVTIFGEPLNQTGYARWSSSGQPDNAGGNENCGSIHRNGGLNDIPCGMKLAFICEQELW